MKFSLFNSRSTISRGFTLIELMVTVGIFVFMTGLILARYNGFNSGTLLTNLAYDVALSIRHAQTFGLSVVTTGGSNFSSAYGVHFNINSPSKYILFSDTDASNDLKANIYLSGSDGDVSTYNLKQGAKISALCVGNGSTCDGPTVTILDISYSRPEPAAVICVNASCATKYGYAEITVTSGDGSSSRVIKVNKIGQIQVEN